MRHSYLEESANADLTYLLQTNSMLMITTVSGADTEREAQLYAIAPPTIRKI